MDWTESLSGAALTPARRKRERLTGLSNGDRAQAALLAVAGGIARCFCSARHILPCAIKRERVDLSRCGSASRSLRVASPR